MTKLWRGLGNFWNALRDSRYRRQRRSQDLEDQRYADRQARHDAGIFEPPRGGSGV